MYNFTIIIPHYNIPRLLKRCVDSIPERNDIQIVVVDDCSTQCPELESIIHSLKLRKNLEIYSTPQGGSAGRARNVGMDHAKGKWLIFADADDFFDDGFAQFMKQYINATEDIIYYNFRNVLSENITQTANRLSTYNDFFNEYKRDQNEDKFRFSYCTPWGKMIKRNFVVENNIRFEETRYANDVMFSVLSGCKARSVLVVDTPIYVLTEREGSLTGNFCTKPHETLIRAQVALNAHKVIFDYGYSFNYEYDIYIKILLWNKEFNDLLTLYRSIKSYGISKCHLLRIVHRTGLRYWSTCLWLICNDIILTVLRK